ncbi:MAG TPA: polysaccharide deacetylase family protein [Solirubrobacteraceae bacterium]|nr:polysaccharide deacetylase family protein [Solirubrobacteraceae bacterium]
MSEVALTFDDGPHPMWTREILRVLSETPTVPATFFVWGEQALDQPERISEMLRAGHSVQPHCWRHLAHWDLDAAQIRADIDRVSALLARFDVPAPRMWRPPWGRLRRTDSRRIAEERGLELAGWTVDSHDWMGRPGDELYADVKARIAAARNEPAVVLMHDSFVEARQARHRSDCEGTVELVRRLIDDEELTFMPLRHGLSANLTESPEVPAPGTEGPGPG